MPQRKRTKKQSLMDDLNEIDQMNEIRRNQILSLQFSINCKFKNQKQKEMYNTIMSNRITFVRGAAGTGKAQTLSSKILTPTGWINMGDIKIGDNVITPDNKISKVIGVYPQGLKDIYKITFSDDSFAFSCKEHLWVVKKESEINKDFEVIELQEIMSNLRNNIEYSIPIVDQIEFEKKDLNIDPYLLGLILKDDSFFDKNSELENYGLDINSDFKFIPNEYLFSTIDDRKMLLSGLLDSNGQIDKKNNTIYYRTRSKKLSDDITELVNSLGGVSKLVKNKIKYKGTGFSNILNYVLSISLDYNPFLLKRKSDLYLKKLKSKPTRYIKSVEFLNKEQAQCIAIDDDKHLYVTDNYIVTHNTLISLLTALKCIKDSNVNIDQIVLTKPIVEITSTKGLGALPGDVNEKTLSYYTHFYDNLIKLIGNEATKYLKTNEVIKETILNYLRGSTFGKWDSNGNPIGSFCIFDEAQNCSIVEMKTFISRMGEESKLVIMGDSDQIDLKLNKGEKCGLDDAWDRLQGIDGIGFIEFSEDDIVRDPFLIEIMKRYKTN
jgi:phosphate starvation-inducible protein PhoH